jgi:hypothetical protein
MDLTSYNINVILHPHKLPTLKDATSLTISACLMFAVRLAEHEPTTNATVIALDAQKANLVLLIT